ERGHRLLEQLAGPSDLNPLPLAIERLEARRLLIGRARAQAAQHAAQRVDLTPERFRVAAPDRLPERRGVLAGLAHDEVSDRAEQPRIAPDLLEQLRFVGRDRPPI